MERPVFRQRLRRRAAPVAVLILAAALVSSVASGALAETRQAPGGELSDFELGGTAGLVDYKFSYPNLVLPYVITGGVFESFSLAAGTGRAQGLAGFMPVPIAMSGALLVPTNDPITGTAIPEGIRSAMKSIDFTAFPNQCESDYPAVAQNGDERYCGGPASEDARLGFTAAMANGHTKSSGSSDDGLASANESTSRGNDVSVPSLQMTIHDAWSKATTKRNGDGVPESRSETEIDGLALFTGLIRIDGVRSQAVAQSDGTSEGVKATTAFNVREVRVAGIPVIVGRDGVSVNSQALVPGQSMQQATDAVTQALAKNELQLRLVPAPPPQQNGAQVSVQSGGIEIVHKGTTVTPADSVYRIGFTSARASAVRATVDEFGDGLGSTPAETSAGSSATLPTDLRSETGPAGSSSGGRAESFGESSSGDPSIGDTSSGTTGAGGFELGSTSAGATGGSEAGSPTESAAPTAGSGQSGATTRLTGAVDAATVSRLPAASVKYVFAVFVALLLLGACAVPLRR
ncbi:MAG TPA: choice-of-anchor P family protein [Acidimicrobiia bacterium]|nr:choice-of-anchor P family protein [Acidimicrobiia bacterium]